jgi:hypothetical protein
MSDVNDTTSQETLLNDATGGKVDKVLVSSAEVEAALEFWKHFEVPVDPVMLDAFTKFCSDPSVENQRTMKIEVCRAISSSEHDAFKDEMMSKIIDECKSVYYDAQFDKDLEETLSQDKENK